MPTNKASQATRHGKTEKIIYEGLSGTSDVQTGDRIARQECPNAQNGDQIARREFPKLKMVTG